MLRKVSIGVTIGDNRKNTSLGLIRVLALIVQEYKTIEICLYENYNVLNGFLYSLAIHL